MNTNHRNGWPLQYPSQTCVSKLDYQNRWNNTKLWENRSPWVFGVVRVVWWCLWGKASSLRNFCPPALKLQPHGSIPHRCSRHLEQCSKADVAYWRFGWNAVLVGRSRFRTTENWLCLVEKCLRLLNTSKTRLCDYTVMLLLLARQ